MIDITLLRKKAQALPPCVRIGKKGITQSTYLEIMKQLKQKRLIKIKFLRSFLEEHDKHEAAGEIIAKTGALAVQQVGFTLILFYRRKEK